jgi:hypothetical protein
MQSVILSLNFQSKVLLTLQQNSRIQAPIFLKIKRLTKKENQSHDLKKSACTYSTLIPTSTSLYCQEKKLY